MIGAGAANGPVRVLLCDDSAAARAAISRMLACDAGIKVVAKASDGGEALAQLTAMAPADRPQVVLLDLEMPRMDGMTALPLLLKAAPQTAIIVASALSQRGATATMAALRAGAVDYVPKPSAAAGGMSGGQFQAELVAKIKGWARMRHAPARPAMTRPPMQERLGLPLVRPRVIGIGSSTGGPQALAALVARLDRPLAAPVIVVQHMPAGFTTLLADHLNRIGTLPCSEARDGEKLLAGRLYLAPGDRHLLVQEQGGGLVALLSDGPPENFCRPAVDPMLRSLVATCQGRVLVAVLTGMGSDGLAGCRAVSSAGGAVLAQDEASSVVWGMPGAVAKAGIASAILTVEEIAGRILAAGADGKAPMNNDDFAEIAGVVRRRSGIVLTSDKAYLLETRLGPVLSRFSLASLAALGQRLRQRPDEILERAVVEALTTHESSFFRDGKPFEHLTKLLPRLLAGRNAGTPLRIWSAACSTGQEPYSIAMLVSEALSGRSDGRVDILATDISAEILQRARQGVFTQFEVQRGLPIRSLVKHFRQDGSKWRIAPELAAMVRFEERNLLTDLSALGRFDAIFCRNVLIYFDAPTKTRVLEALARRLGPDGVLYLGGAETVLGLTDRLTPIQGERGAYGVTAQRAAA